jgi:hypothetical protein
MLLALISANKAPITQRKNNGERMPEEEGNNPREVPKTLPTVRPKEKAFQIHDSMLPGSL